MWRSETLVIIAVCLLGLFLVRASREPPLDVVDAEFVNWLAENSRRDSKPAPLVFVEINDSSLGGQPWPWSPFDYALYFQAVLPFGPAVVACEPILNWNDEGAVRDTQYDRILSKYIRRSPKVLLGASLGQHGDSNQLELHGTPHLPHVIGDTSSLLKFSMVENEPWQQFSVSAQLGFVNLNPAQSKICRVPLVFLLRGQVVPSFALQAVMLWLKLTPDDIVVEVGKSIALGYKLVVPIDDRGMVFINFGTPITRFGMDDLLLAAEQTEANLPAGVPVEQIRGNVVLLGRNDDAAKSVRLSDDSHAAPGAILAATIATIQTKTFICRVAPWFDFALVGFLMLCSALWIRLRPALTISSSIALLVVYLLASLAVFDRYLIWLPLLLPTGLVLFLMIWALIVQSLRNRKLERSKSKCDQDSKT